MLSVAPVSVPAILLLNDVGKEQVMHPFVFEETGDGGTRAMPNTDFRIRRATPSDADAIARAHRDSIETIGPRFYPAEIVGEWSSGLTPDKYRRAMEHGEVFFIAVDEHDMVLGFSTHRIDGRQHGTAVYVRGSAARRGVGSALYRLAEADAVRAGAGSILIDASLAAVEFYKAHGFDETGRGHHRLRSGCLMPCVFMRKALALRSEH
jgi:putative acetyltransferase